MVRRWILIVVVLVALAVGLVGGYYLRDYSGTRSPSAPVQYNLMIQSMPGGSVSQPGEGALTYEAGSTVTLVATPTPGYRFSHWSGGVVGINPTATLIMDRDRCVFAVFKQVVHEHAFSFHPHPEDGTEIDPEDLLASLYGKGISQRGLYFSRLFFLERGKPVEVVVRQRIVDSDTGQCLDGALLKGTTYSEATSGYGSVPQVWNLGGLRRVDGYWEYILVFTPVASEYYCLYLLAECSNGILHCEYAISLVSQPYP